MKLREVPEPVSVPPPLHLRRWDCPPMKIGAGEQTGRQAFASRDEWVAARHAWRSGQGQPAGEWWAAEMARARAEGGVIELLAYALSPDIEVDGW